MSQQMVDLCQVKVRGEWIDATIDEALTVYAGLAKRCPECHGEVRAHKQYNTGSRAHFEHLVVHAGCSLKPRTFSGTRTFHPLALS